MAPEDRVDLLAARTAGLEEIPELLISGSEDLLRSLIENPAFDETHLCLLLERKDLSGLLLEEISKRHPFLELDDPVDNDQLLVGNILDTGMVLQYSPQLLHHVTSGPRSRF